MSAEVSDANASPREIACDLIRRGIAPVPIPFRTKKPVVKAWQNLRITEAMVDAHFNGSPQNVGGLMGEPSGGKVDVDLDAREALAIAPHLLPPTGMTFGRASKPESHWVYESALETVKFRDPLGDTDDRAMLLEIRSTGCQTVMPGSVHESGERIIWHQLSEPAHVEPAELLRVCGIIGALALLARYWPKSGNRHDAALALAGGLLRSGVVPNDARDYMRIVAETAGDVEVADRVKAVDSTVASIEQKGKIVGWKRLAEIIDAKVIAKVRTWLGLRGAGALDEERVGLPQIIVTGRPTEQISKDCVQALVEANDPPHLFVRSGEIVRLDGDEEGRPIIRRVELAHLRYALARSARCVTVRAGEGGQEQTHVAPPRHIVEDIMASPQVPLPPLAGVIEAPVLRPDGSVLSSPGYDPATKLVYVPARGLDVPPISESPTQADAHAALTDIVDAIGEFPYESQASRANALGAMLTPVVRQLINGNAPLGIFDAPSAGSGKSLLAESVAITATGRASALMTLAKDDAEMRKQITSHLANGATVINIDNVDGKIWHPSLAAVLTRDVWEDRLLSTNKTLRVPQRASWFATGNNVCLGGDIPRRSYWIRIDARMMRPWKRTNFRHPDLLPWVGDNRGRLLAALLIMARAWIVAGKPDGGTPVIGSFEAWCRTVGGILAYAGVNGFLGNLTQMYETADDDTAQWCAFLRAWHVSLGDKPVTTGLVLRWLENSANHVAREALPGSLGDPVDSGFTRRLGWALKAQIGRRFAEDGLRVERVGDDGHAKVASWRVATD